MYEIELVGAASGHDLVWFAKERQRLADFWFDAEEEYPSAIWGSNTAPRDLERTLAMAKDPNYGAFIIRDPNNPDKILGMFDFFESTLPAILHVRGEERDDEFWEGDEYFLRMNHSGRSFGRGVNGYYLMVDPSHMQRGIATALVDAFTNHDWGPNVQFVFSDLAIKPCFDRVLAIFVKRFGYTKTSVIVSDADGSHEWAVYAHAVGKNEIVTDENGLAIGTRAVA